MPRPQQVTAAQQRDAARREAHGDAWADAVAALAAKAPKRLTPQQARLVKTSLRLDPSRKQAAS